MPTRNGSIATTAPELTTPRSPREAQRTQARFPWDRLGITLGAGIVAGLCFPPFDLGPLVVVAVAVLVWTWRDASPRHAALFGFAFGVGCYGVVLEWARLATEV